jgi:hypothetical protein
MGPVLFIFDVEKLMEQSTGKIWITKSNPTDWRGAEHHERWFQSTDEVKANLTHGTFGQMIIFRHSGGILPFYPESQKLFLRPIFSFRSPSLSAERDRRGPPCV